MEKQSSGAETWVLEQAHAFIKQLPKDQRDKFYVQHDRDTKFTKTFDETLKGANAKIMKNGPMAEWGQPSSCRD